MSMIGKYGAPAVRPIARAGLAVLLALLLSGCGTAVIGSITLGQISAAAGVASVGTTGKGLQDHALSAITGRDCRVLEGIVRANRQICELPGSPATEDDFRGVATLLGGPGAAGEPEVLYAGLASDFRPSLMRPERRRPAAARRDIEIDGPVEIPSIRDWARTRPAPAIQTASFTAN